MDKKNLKPIPPDAPIIVRKTMLCALALLFIALLALAVTVVLTRFFHDLAIFEYAKNGAAIITTGATAIYLILFSMFTRAFATIGKTVAALMTLALAVGLTGYVTLGGNTRGSSRAPHEAETGVVEPGSAEMPAPSPTPKQPRRIPPKRPAATRGCHIVTHAGAKLYRGPGFEEDAIAPLPNHSSFAVLDISRDGPHVWYRIRFRTKAGWVPASNVSLTEQCRESR
jgi:hypothetical protein